MKRGLVMGLTLGGLVLNLLLLFWKLAGSDIAGCGGGQCEAVFSSRWSQVFGLPLPALGVLVYLALLLRKYETFCCAAIAGTSLWLIFVQAVILRQFCPWCMAAHGVGIAVVAIKAAGRIPAPPWPGHAARKPLSAGLASALLLALAQLYGPVPAAYRIESAAVQSATVFGPQLGPAGAKIMLKEYFDYQCPACRKMSAHLDALMAGRADIAVRLFPVPLDRGCNPSLPAADAGHPGSCELTRIALAVWRVKPEAFPAIHRAFLADPPPAPAVALEMARKEVPSLDAVLSQGWIDEVIRENVSDWDSLSGTTRQLPKLVIRGKRVLHGLPPELGDFIRVIESEL